MIISLIAAVAENRVIGKDNDLIWSLPLDTRYFMDKTRHHHIITGRRNYESIPAKYRPLKDRTNIIVTHQKTYEAPGAVVVNTLEEAIKLARQNGEEELFIIGGGEIYEQSISLADKLYITEVKASFEGDVFFPKIDKNRWKEIERIPNFPDEKHAHAFDFVKWVKQ